MNNFCTKCGSRLVDGQPCQYCGGAVQQQPQFNQPSVGVDMNNINVNQQNPNFNMGNSNVQQPVGNVSLEKFNNKKAIAGLTLGIIAFFVFGFLAFFGLPMSITGLTDAKEHNGAGKGIAIAGIVVCGIDCVLILLNIILKTAGLA